MSSPHVVTVPLPVQGHFAPMMYLSKKLAEQGLTVTVVNVECVHQQLVEEWNWPPELDIRLQSIHLDLPTPRGTVAANNEDPVAFMSAMYNLQEEFVKLVRKLLERGEIPKISCIISDFFNYWGYTAARDLGVAHAVYWPASAAWCLTEYYLPKLVSSGDLPLGELDLSSGKLICYPGLGALEPCHLPTHYTDEVIALIGPERMRMATEQLEDSAWIIVNSAYELEPATFDALRTHMNSKVLSVAPLFSPEDIDDCPKLLAEDAACLAWLDGKSPGSVLYVSFGSIARLSVQQTEELALGLETSGISFLWVLRQESMSELPGDFYKGFLERIMDRGLVLPWVPQKQVLSHSAVGAFLTHCGWNSVLESISSGLPMLTLPQLYDQTLNNMVVVNRWKAGFPLLASSSEGGQASITCELRKEHISQSIRATFGDGLCAPRTRSEMLQQVLASAVAPGGASSRKLLDFVQELRQKTV